MRFTQIDVFSLYTDIDDTSVWFDTHKYLFLTLFWFLWKKNYFIWITSTTLVFLFLSPLLLLPHTTQISFIVPFLKN